MILAALQDEFPILDPIEEGVAEIAFEGEWFAPLRAMGWTLDRRTGSLCRPSTSFEGYE